MSQARVIFTQREVTEALIKQAGLFSGHWAVGIEFGLQQDEVFRSGVAVPATVIGTNNVTLCEFEIPNAITVNAAEVNAKAST